MSALGAERYRQLLDGHLPYSSFNYVSLCCYWPDALVAPLADGVALVLDTPIDTQPFITALTHTPALSELCQLASTINLDASLRLVPECSLQWLPSELIASERPDGFDYILSLADMLNPEAPGMAEKHQIAQQCRSLLPGLTLRELPLQADSTQTALRQIDSAYHAHRRGNGAPNGTSTWERQAFLNCLALGEQTACTALVAFDGNGNPLGFTLNELLADGYYMAHFGKTLPGHEGLSELLELETAKLMQEHGCQHMNFQEDHGNAGLRRMKQSWNPCRMLKVFDVHPL